jgi:hypothetical protein
MKRLHSTQTYLVRTGLLPLVFMLSLSGALGQQGTSWTRVLHGVSAGPNTVRQTTDGGYLLARNTGKKIHLTKLAFDGSTEWSRTYAAPDPRHIYSCTGLAVAEDGYFLAGSHNRMEEYIDLLLIRTDLHGEALWQKDFGRTGLMMVKASVKTTPEGGAFIFGTQVDDFRYSTFFIETGSKGSIHRDHSEGNRICKFGPGVQCGDEGHLMLGAGPDGLYSCVSRLDKSGNSIWDRCFAGCQFQDILPAGDGSYLLLGSRMTPKHNFEAILKNIDAGGNELWSRTYSVSSQSFGFQVVHTRDGGYGILTGGISSEFEAKKLWIIKTNERGHQQWTKVLNTGADCWNGAFLCTRDGGFILFTNLQQEKGRNDVLMVKTDAEGNVGLETSGQEDLEYDFRLSPNPVTDLLRIDTEWPGHKRLEIISMNGQQVCSGIMEGDVYEVETHTWPAGCYVIRMHSGNRSMVKKIIKL